MQTSARSIGLSGRFLASVRTNHFVVDAGPNRDGTAEAPTPGEYLLTGIASCATVVIHAEARRLALGLTSVEAVAEILRDPDNSHSIIGITLRVITHGASRPDAERLLQIYIDECPVYALIARGTDIAVSLDVAD